MAVGVRVVRRVVVGVCILGIAGMIAGSVAGNDGVALTAGLVAAVAVAGLMLTTAVAGGASAHTEALAEQVEVRVRALVAGGADEQAVRDLVRDAVRMGRGT